MRARSLWLGLLVLGACSAPAERVFVPRVGFVWPAAWPLPTEASCLAGRQPGRDLRELSSALAVGALDAAARVEPRLRAKAPKVDLVRLGGAELALLGGDPHLALERAGSLAGEQCWGLRLIVAEAHIAIGDVDAAWSAVRPMSPAGTLSEAALWRRSELAAMHRLSLEQRIAAARSNGSFGEARTLAQRLVAEHPAETSGFRLLAEIEVQAGEPMAAIEVLQGALVAFPGNRELLGQWVDVAAKAELWDSALEAIRALVEIDPSARPRLEDIERNWALSSSPPAVQQAAASTHASRGDIAVLMWWALPELRALELQDAPIAVDLVGRADKTHVIRALALGLWDVDPVTRNAEPDRSVGRNEFLSMLIRLAEVLDRRLPDDWALAPGRGLSGYVVLDALTRFRRDIFLDK